MRAQNWGRLLAFAVAAIAQTTTTVQDLGSLLSDQKDLRAFYSLIQKYPQILLRLPSYSGVTILAPNSKAFEKIPYTELKAGFGKNDQDIITNVLEYHILQGTKTAAQLVPGTPVFLATLLTSTKWTNVTGGQRVQSVKQAGDVVVFVSGQGTRSTLTHADLSFTGGIVQVIDSLLIPPSNLTVTTTAYDLTALQGALYTTQLLESFSSAPNVTIFAPRNEAFEALGPAISSLSVEQLASVLNYHVLPQTIYSTSLTNGTTFTTCQGGNITILRSGNNVYINSAQLVTADLLLANGVLHIVDNVLNPLGPGAHPNPVIESQAPVFASASHVDDVPFTTAIPCTSSCPTTTVASGTKTTARSSSIRTISSKALGATMARETGAKITGKAGLMVALGSALILVR